VTIVVVNNSGLGNRIKNIVSAVRKGHLIGDVVDIQCGHESLFKVAQCVIEPLRDHREVMSTWGLKMLPEEEKRKILREPRRLVEYHDRSYHGVLEGTIDLQYFNIEQEVIDEFLRYFALIVFNQKIIEYVDSLSSGFQVNDKVGVHVRSWYDAPDRHSILFRIEDFYKKLDALADEKSFVLCVDHYFVRDAILKRYGRHRVLEPLAREIGHVSFDARGSVGFHSLVDMLLLSRCGSLVGTYQSTFSECAWWLGGGSKLVYIPIPGAILELEEKFYSQQEGSLAQNFWRNR